MISSLTSSQNRCLSIAASFDALAQEYDSVWSCGFIGRLQRRQVWRELDPIFKPGDRVLELGCGTGMDAAHLADLGIQVHATDISPGMLRATRERMQERAISHNVTCELLPIERLSRIQDPGPYDGALSNFGAFNCVQDLRSAASDLARLVRPGGKFVLCLIGRFCLWETVWHLIHARPGKAFRRLRAGSRGLAASLKTGFQVPVFYPSISSLVAAFRRDFGLVSFRSVGVLVPPSYLEQWAMSRREVFERMALLDDRVGQWPVLRGIGDHRLAVFMRKSRNA